MTPAFSTNKLISVMDSANFLTDSLDEVGGVEHGRARPRPCWPHL